MKKNFSALFFLQIAHSFRVRWRPEAVNARLQFSGCLRLTAVSAPARTAALRPLPVTALSASLPGGPPHPLTPPTLHPWTRRRPRAPRAGRSGTIRDVTRPRLNQTRRLGNFKLKGGAVRALWSGGGRASAPVLWGLARQDGGGRGCRGLREGPTAQQQVGRPDRDQDPAGASGAGLSRRALAAPSGSSAWYLGPLPALSPYL